MKTVYPILFLMIFIISGCREIQPIIKPINTLSKRKVLVEEMTGVGCQNCPDGSIAIRNLSNLYPDNLIAVAFYEGFFADITHSNQRFDFRTTDGEDLIYDYFGEEAFAYPAAVINRQKTPTDKYYFEEKQWAGEIAEELQEELQVDLNLNHSYDADLRELNFEVEVSAKTNIEKDLKISAYITEDGIVDYQYTEKDPPWQSDYVHNHVLRKIITDIGGEQILDENWTEGKSVLKNFSFNLPTEWDAKNSNLIVFVHRNTPDSREVLNAEKVHLID